MAGRPALRSGALLRLLESEDKSGTCTISGGGTLHAQAKFTGEFLLRRFGGGSALRDGSQLRRAAPVPAAAVPGAISGGGTIIITGRPSRRMVARISGGGDVNAGPGSGEEETVPATAVGSWRL